MEYDTNLTAKHRNILAFNASQVAQFVRSRQLNRLVAADGILCTFATLMFYVLYLVVFDWGASRSCFRCRCRRSSSTE